MKKRITTPTKIKGKRVHGFRRRKSTSAGKLILKRRRSKGRKALTM